jgi:hypothetical protein
MARQVEVDRLVRELADVKASALRSIERITRERDAWAEHYDTLATRMGIRSVNPMRREPVPTPPAVAEWEALKGKLIPMPEPTFVPPSALEELARAVLNGRIGLYKDDGKKQCEWYIGVEEPK